MNDTLNCSFCVFFEGNRQEHAVGNCRRHPPICFGLLPTVGLDGKTHVQPVFGYPKVRSKADWCGEFQTIPEVAEDLERARKAN